MIVDTHIHLYDEKFKDQINEIIDNAFNNNVNKLICVGCDYDTSKKCIELASKYPFIYCAVGIHPSEVQKEEDLELSWIYELAKNDKVVAIGEIGLDYYWDKSYTELQKSFFIKQIQIANKLNLPVIIHSRDAHLDTYEILKQNRCRGVLHCYSSSLELAREYVKMGMYLGIGGVLTFTNSKEIKRVVEEIDIDHLVTETDAPYLAPVPYRGKINKPEYLHLIIEKISTLKNQNKEIIEEKLYNNAHRLFNIKH